jgi:hypothetical protein
MEGMDGIAFHPYNANAGASGNTFTAFRDTVAPYGFAGKVWVNEIGFPTRGEDLHQTEESKMPETVAKTMTLLLAGGARTVFWYQMFDDGGSDSFGLVNTKPSWQRKGGYWGYALCAQHLPGKTYKTDRYQHLTVPYEMQSFYFEGTDGSRVLIVWNAGLSNKTVNVSLPGSNRKHWSVVTGKGKDIPKDYTATLYPNGKNQDAEPSLLFLTWQE